jgi:hypothetical protein
VRRNLGGWSPSSAFVDRGWPALLAFRDKATLTGVLQHGVSGIPSKLAIVPLGRLIPLYRPPATNGSSGMMWNSYS